MNESDYMVVKEYNEDHMVYAYWADSKPNQVDYAPDFSSDSASASNHYKSATLISAGDNAIVQNLEKGDLIHVYAPIDGHEYRIRQYYVK